MESLVVKVYMLIFVFCLYCFLVLVRALSMDMFFDGTIYASIAQNMALGKGSFWHLYYTEQFLNPFYEHPPLAMWLQSIAFRIFGSSWRVEFIWGAICGLITLVFIKKTYEEFDTPAGAKNVSWWPILLFISIPTVTWTFANNLLENTMIVFTTGAVYYAIKALKENIQLRIYGYSAISGFLIFAGLMTKGLPALFPLAVPFIWMIFNLKEEGQAKKSSLMCFARMLLYMFFAAAIVNVFSGGELLKFFGTYMNEQVMKSVSGQREGIKHFYLFNRFVGEIIVPIFIAGVIYLAIKIKKIHVEKLAGNNRTALMFLFIALSASLPMFFIPKQRIWYLFPSFVFYAMAVAKYSEHLIAKIKTPAILKYVSIVLFLAGLTTLIFFGGLNFKRNNDLYKDVISQKELIPSRAVIYACPTELAKEWEVNAFIQRFCLASLTDDQKRSTGLTLIDKTKKEGCNIPKDRILINKNPARYELYK